MSIKFNPSSVPLLSKLKPLWRYRVMLFIVFVAGLSMYLVMQINSALNVAPTQPEATASSSTTPRIDPTLAEKLKSLEDNSVTVKALFNEARENPFQ